MSYANAIGCLAVGLFALFGAFVFWIYLCVRAWELWDAAKDEEDKGQ